MKIPQQAILFVLLCLGASSLAAQQDVPFQKEVAQLVARNRHAPVGSPIVFAGSSSFRYWTSMAADLKDSTIVNNGFGGSQFADLLRYLDELVLSLNPRAVFIYEGDNDADAGKSPQTILAQARETRERIRARFPEVPVYFVSPKPSVLRAAKAPAYMELNALLQSWADTEPKTYFIDIWTPMMKADGAVDETLFIDDRLHLNEKGYAIWIEVLTPYIRQLGR